MIPPWKICLVIGGLFLLVGIILWMGERFSLPLGRLPGDIRIEKQNFSFYFPLGTCLAVSLFFTLIALALGRYKK